MGRGTFALRPFHTHLLQDLLWQIQPLCIPHSQSGAMYTVTCAQMISCSNVENLHYLCAELYYTNLLLMLHFCVGKAVATDCRNCLTMFSASDTSILDCSMLKSDVGRDSGAIILSSNKLPTNFLWDISKGQKSIFRDNIN